MKWRKFYFKKIYIIFLTIISVALFTACNNNSLNKKQDAMNLENEYEKAYRDFFEKKQKGLVTEKKPQSLSFTELDCNINLHKVSEFCKEPNAPDIYDNKLVFYDISLSNRPIYLYDTQTKDYRLIYSTPLEGLTIQDPKIGDKWIFWTEAPLTIDKGAEKWRIKAYNIENKSVKTIREGGFETNSTLIPRIENENNTLIWLEGTLENNKLSHKIYMYNAEKDEIEEITRLNKLENPYTVLDIKNNIISYMDFINNSWSIILLDTKNRNILRIPLKEKSMFEIPRKVISNNNYTAYITTFSALYIYLHDLEETIFVESAGSVASADSFIVFARSGELYIYVVDENKICNLSQGFKEKKNMELYFNYIGTYENKVIALASNEKNTYIASICVCQ